ncbi:hypothetical protein MRX96_054908 [Rhipicephalus microplus]
MLIRGRWTYNTMMMNRQPLPRVKKAGTPCTTDDVESPDMNRERLTVLAWQDLGRGLLLSENPHLRARFQIVHRRRDERRKVLAWRGRALSGYRLPSDGSFTRPLTLLLLRRFHTGHLPDDDYVITGTQPAHSLLAPKHRHRLTVLAWQDLGRGLLLSENPHLRARFQIVHRRRDERRKVLAWRGRALSGYRLPSDGSFTRPLTLLLLRRFHTGHLPDDDYVITGTQPAHSLLAPQAPPRETID